MIREALERRSGRVAASLLAGVAMSGTFYGIFEVGADPAKQAEKGILNPENVEAVHEENTKVIIGAGALTFLLSFAGLGDASCRARKSTLQEHELLSIVPTPIDPDLTLPGHDLPLPEAA